MVVTFGVVGAGGKFGRWLVGLFQHHYPGSTVLTIDVDSDTPDARKSIVANSDVLVFAVPIPATTRVIQEYASILHAEPGMHAGNLQLFSDRRSALWTDPGGD